MEDDDLTSLTWLVQNKNILKGWLPFDKIAVKHVMSLSFAQCFSFMLFRNKLEATSSSNFPNK